ncbi:MAG: hypothetical protein ACW98F_17740 [Candidatus Hodarchaeales archaeon]|jgi:hypothetical protein
MKNKKKELFLIILVVFPLLFPGGVFSSIETRAKTRDTDYCFVTVSLYYFYCIDAYEGGTGSVGEFYGMFQVNGVSYKYEYWDIDVAEYTYAYGNRKTIKPYEYSHYALSRTSVYSSDPVSVAQGTKIYFEVWEFDPWPNPDDLVISNVYTTIPSDLGLGTSTYQVCTFYEEYDGQGGGSGNTLKVVLTFFRTA